MSRGSWLPERIPKGTILLGLLGGATLATAALAEEALAETGETLLSAQVELAEWGLEDPAAIRLGRLSVAQEPSGEALYVYHLRTEDPQQPDFDTTSRRLDADGGCVRVADFQAGNVNRLGGDFNVFERRPSRADFDIDRRPHGRRTLRLDYRRSEAGFAGFWMHLYPSRDRRLRAYLDTRELDVLSIWVRGREGGERLRVKLADRRLDRLGDSLPVGDLDAYLPEGGLSTSWQRAAVPLAALPPALDRSALATLVLEAVAGAGSVELGPVALCPEGAAPPGLPASGPRFAVPDRETALWVWNTAELVAAADRRRGFLTFLERSGIDQVYLQLPNTTGVPARLAAGASADGLRALVAAIGGLGLSVRALDGHASFVLPEQQEKVLQTIRDVVAFNAAARPKERFVGVHYDVEPYLLPGFGGSGRQTILDRYVELVSRMAVLARRHDLLLGVDLPFWYDAPDEFSQELLTVDFAGRRRPIIEHVIDLTDYVTLMDYRTRAFGPDGVLFHAAGELDYAGRVGKTVYLGLETGPLPDERYLTFSGAAAAGLPTVTAPGTTWAVIHREESRATIYVIGADELEELRQRLPSAGVVHWPVRGQIDIPASKLTFADLGREALDTLLRQVAQELRATPGFGGFALHHYGSLVALPTSPAP